MQLLLKVTENNAVIVELGGGLQMPPAKAFIDDTTILSSKKSTTRKILSLMEKQMNWCKMKFKPQKSRLWYINQAKEISRTLQEGFHKIDHCPLQGKFKVWCLQHIFILMLLWPILVYKIATTMVESMEAKINKYTWKWLGLPPGLSDVALYSRQAKLKLPFKSLVEEFKSGKIRFQMILDESKDKVIKSLKPTWKTVESQGHHKKS